MIFGILLVFIWQKLVENINSRTIYGFHFTNCKLSDSLTQ